MSTTDQYQKVLADNGLESEDGTVYGSFHLTEDGDKTLCGAKCIGLSTFDVDVLELPPAIEADGNDNEWCAYCIDECRIDKTPAGHPSEASQTYSGEVFTEYGIVDLSENFPSEPYEWRPEFGPVEDHHVVPFRVVRRGIKNLSSAERRAKSKNEEAGWDRFKAVLLTDSRGL